MKRERLLSAVAVLTAAALSAAILPVYGAEDPNVAAGLHKSNTAADFSSGAEVRGSGTVLKHGKAGETVKARNTMISLAQTYDSPTKWLIMTNVTTHMVGVFYRNGSYWDLRREYLTSTGAPESPTVEGEFSVQSKIQHFGTSSYRCWYATQFCGNYLFHSVLYNVESEPRTVQDDRLGMAISHGCVRMKLYEAKWIYDNIPSGTKVVVYH